MVAGDRVLVYEQTDATQNGVYTVTDIGSGSTNWVLTRATDADSYGASDPNSFGQGDAFFVLEGGAGAGELYVMNTQGAITFGTTDITFAQVASTQIYVGGTGVNINGNQISIDQSVDTTDNVTFNNVTATGELDIPGEIVAGSYNESYAAVTSTSNATTVNCHDGNAFSHTLTENTTFTYSNPPASGTAFSFSLQITQDASASGYTVTWPTSVDWTAATAPTLTDTASAVDVFVFYTHDGGTTWQGFVAGQNQGTPA